MSKRKNENSNSAVTAVISITLLVTLTTIISSVVFAYISFDSFEVNTAENVEFGADDTGVYALSGNNDVVWDEVQVEVSNTHGERVLVDHKNEGSIEAGDKIYGIDEAIIELSESSSYTITVTNSKGVLNKFELDKSQISRNEYEQKNNAPDSAIIIAPLNGESNVEINPTLNVKVNDIDGDILSVIFYWSDGSEIGSQDYIKSGDAVTIKSIPLEYDKEYSWYVIVNDNKGKKTNSDIWTFTTKDSINSPPQIKNGPSPADKENDVTTNPTLWIGLLDLDNDEMDATFYNADDDSVIGASFNVENGKTTSTRWEGLNEKTTYRWYVEITDGKDTFVTPRYSFTTEESDQVGHIKDKQEGIIEIPKK